MPKKKKSKPMTSMGMNVPDKDEERKWQAESKVVSAIKDTPKFRRAVRKQIAADKKSERETKRIVAGSQ